MNVLGWNNLLSVPVFTTTGEPFVTKMKFCQLYFRRLPAFQSKAGLQSYMSKKGKILHLRVIRWDLLGGNNRHSLLLPLFKVEGKNLDVFMGHNQGSEWEWTEPASSFFWGVSFWNVSFFFLFLTLFFHASQTLLSSNSFRFPQILLTLKKKIQKVSSDLLFLFYLFFARIFSSGDSLKLAW